MRECAVNVSESAAVLDALPTLPGSHGIPADAWRALSQRDSAMAVNVLSALSHARSGNVLLFAHTSHILNAPMRGGASAANSSLRRAWVRYCIVRWGAATWPLPKSNL
ncbi:MAG TPA: hypothetical protein VMU48_04365 [Terracidiphilus sp.]|nr:hypothetical protein [Terracidiphilus sp.]